MAARIITSQVLTISGTAARSTAMGLGLKYVIKPTESCWIRFGNSAVDAVAAAANNWPLAAYETIEYTPTGSADQFVSVIGTSGSLVVGIEEGG